MPSTYSNLKIQLMSTGENNTSWGDVTNTNLGTALEEAVVGSADIAFSNANVTLTLTDTNATQTARNLRLNLTGAAAAGYSLTVPAIEKPYIVSNGTNGTITVKNATGSGVAVPSGETMWVYNNGTNVLDVTTHLTTLTLSTPLAVSSGGTGANTSSGARTNLGLGPLATLAAGSNGQLAIGNGTGYTLATLTAGSNISITNGTGSITIAASGVGLTNWTEGVNTSAPNATVPVVYFNATNAATNVDAVVAPKGTGALLAAVPDSTAAGGSKRGSYAVDLQLSRGTATNVASGNYATISGGLSNTASGTYAVVSGGTGNTASANQSGVLSGTSNTASGLGNSVVIGGGSNTASGSYALAHGFTVLADGIYSFATGTRSTARGLYGARAHSNGRFTADGDAQRVTYTGRISTTNNTVTELTLDGGAGSSTNRVVLPNDSTYVFDILVVARRTDADNESAGYRFTGVIDRNTNAASTAIVGTVAKTVIAEDTAAWDVTVDADTTNGSLRIQVTGETSKTIRWVAVINTVEVVG